MRNIPVSEVTRTIKEMCIEANHFLSSDMKDALCKANQQEKSDLGKIVLGQLMENLEIAGHDMIPICQDTGMAVVFMEIGQEVHFEGVKEAIFTAAKEAGPNACPLWWLV